MAEATAPTAAAPTAPVSTAAAPSAPAPSAATRAGAMLPDLVPSPDPDWVTCCSPMVGEPLDQAAAEMLAAVLKALAEPTRLRLAALVAAHADGEACICDLTEPVGLSQPTVSHHMKVLVDAGLMTREQRGKWAYYRLVPGAIDSLSRVLAQVVIPGGSTPQSARH